jgi:phenylpropionate dioxygenase-like ring-hydroxylating dioxygenase large terminal subunit
MLTREDNELLVRVGPGTPMGKLMRLYWIPFLLSRDIVADGQPQRVRLLGEELLAFRDTSGKVGLVNYACPHRGAPMVFARNEESGLRCMYHGWKFDADGRCTDMPAEPADSQLRHRLRIDAYPVRERGGVLWAYMGPDAEPPPLPDLEWNQVPAEQVALSVRVQECNGLQALEGEIDSAHAAILHGRHDVGGVINTWRQAADLAPSFECVPQPFGLSIASRRKAGEDEQYVRVNQFLLPFWTLVPPQRQFPDLSGHAWVPIDDENTLCLMFSYTPAQPFYERTRQVFKAGHHGRETGHASDIGFEPWPVTEPYHMYRSKYNRANAYRFDYALQVEKYNSGLPGLWVQDAACQSGVMPIYDRTREHLGVTDTGIIQARRLLRDATRRYASEEQRPVSATDPASYAVRALSLTLPTGTDWQQFGGEFMKARLGADFGYTP